ncbi:type 1 glutamine amidotransferase domain-containing protein [Lactobacillus buchneri]|uniref:type 1 glutamine amidotransferase domain-containing protein n=1 Tax=Lentilactobacillus buchneri TaxID=1581 RepID=UPI00129094A9|nr:type 1 glutamine amidotransferase domain-containing protein [Lentilactobacillus buchneri]MQM81663.1 type 1 glutamine amidotransferase domain-containing protein [Lentilactobacillus buchneri]
MTKALMVVTNNPKFKKIQRATGIWLKEATHFNKVMADNGIDVDYVSPKGGYVPLDPLSLGTDDMDATDWEYYLDDTFRNHHLAQSLTPADVNPKDYQVIYFVGGHGTITDFPQNTELAGLAETIYANGGIVSANCVGVCGLLPMRTEDGKRFVHGRKLTAFTNDEEALNGLTNDVEFLLEDELDKAGANFVKGTAFEPNVVVDDRLITGQNPNSATGVGEAIIKELLQ